jgi:Arc/MetJ-type ribon-helix-helix transcriptional regulator
MKIKIPEEIVQRLQERVNSTDEFKDVEEYINYILEQVVERLENENKDNENKGESVFSKEDEEKVKERLRGLGYLD